jgi:SAM-dependent methyltransferase
MTIPTEVWVLPRPRKPYYKGSFPLHFEKKLFRLLGNPEKILHPFGGYSEYGIRIDLNKDVIPDAISNAHYLPFPNETFDLVLCDPPYNDKLSEELYKAPPIHYKKYINEAVRVCKPEGYIASYHWIWTTRPLNTKYYKIIVVLPGQHHRPRICCIFQKDK